MNSLLVHNYVGLCNEQYVYMAAQVNAKNSLTVKCQYKEQFTSQHQSKEQFVTLN